MQSTVALETPELHAIDRQGSRHMRHRIQRLSLGMDAILAYFSLSLGYYLRFNSPLAQVGVQVENLSFWDYQPIIVLGTLFLLFAFNYVGLYQWKLLLRPRRIIPLTIKATGFWFLVFISTSLVLKFDPPISRFFMLIAWFSVTVTIGTWKYLFSRWLIQSHYRTQLTQRIICYGWNQEAASLGDAIYKDPSHPYEMLGIVWPQNNPEEAAEYPRQITPSLGQSAQLESILGQYQPDILVISDVNLDRDELTQVATICEHHYVQLKIIPSMFQIFISGLRLETISGKPLLGVEELAINNMFNQWIKRSVDIAGALVGLSLTLPIGVVLAYLIKREDPGPIFFKQERVGRHHRPFQMLKFRSMKMGADKMDHLNQSTLREDPRVLRIGATMRRWNLDELPQFWNVLVGDMSLVGPRPERTYHVQRLSQEIPHYMPRHEVKPGITGWAQVNGFRGDTDLNQRIQHDLYYIENWSLVLDMYILIMTFFNRDNAY